MTRTDDSGMGGDAGLSVPDHTCTREFRPGDGRLQEQDYVTGHRFLVSAGSLEGDHDKGPEKSEGATEESDAGYVFGVSSLTCRSRSHTQVGLFQNTYSTIRPGY